MNKAAIQRFAMKARTGLIEQVSQRAYQYGITKEGYGDANAVTVGGRALNAEEQRQRKELVDQIQRKGYTQVMEEVAYTWFNRFIALRFMEVNHHLPSHIRVFSDSTGAFRPEILNDVLHLDLPGLNAEKLAAYIENNQTEDLYRYLLLTQCNALNDALPQMFEQMDGYTELLLPNNILKQDSVLAHMVMDIEEADWADQVQIIGWLYQYYNSELKDDTFALLKKNVKITKERIPSATQLFTPDWIVRYMVENSLGRIYIDKRKNEGIYGDGRGLDEMTWKEAEAGRIATEKEIAAEMDWRYYLPEAEQSQEARKQLDEIQRECDRTDIKDIKVIDPCMGSGHILVCAFDVLMQIYEANGYSQRDAVQSILENNLYGFDIDDRAAQLAYFAVMMKARQYDRRIFSRGIQPHVHAIMETNTLGGSYKLAMGDFLLSKEHQETLNYLLDAFIDAKEYGSILQLENRDYEGLMEAWKYTASQTAENINITLWYAAVEHEVPKLIEQAILLTQKYDVVVTNPPYMGSSGMSAKLAYYVKSNYPDSKSDLFAVFLERCGKMAAKNRYQAMITQHAWMFLSSFEKLRTKLLSIDTVNMAHLGARAFEEIGGEVVQTTSFVLRKSHIKGCNGVYCRLIEPTTQQGKEDMFLAGKNRHEAAQDSFSKIPGSPVAYWVSETMRETFSNNTLESFGETYQGIITGDVNKFLRLWYEVELPKITFDGSDHQTLEYNSTFYPYIKGGGYRKWAGNQEYIIFWTNDGKDLVRSRTENRPLFFRNGVTWSLITTTDLSFRWFGKGFLCDVSGSSYYAQNDDNGLYILAFLNSVVSSELLHIVNPTMNVNIKDVMLMPVRFSSQEKVKSLAIKNIMASESDWDSFETSWDFKRHPLVPIVCPVNDRIADAFAYWQKICSDRFNTLKVNEEELNRIFIDSYGLQDELTPEVEDQDVTVRRADLGRDIRSLISYAVGCMFGRYSLNVPGLAYAGGEWDASKYSTYTPDKDNIIPICDDDYFDDDITGRFVKWVATVYGSETLEENLKFIAAALGGSGTPRELIRDYFLSDKGFYADHLKIYQKRPIYWLCDSGKKNGFKALIYMHRYQSDLLARMRTDYVHEQQERYRTQLMHIADAIDHASASERVKLTKQQKKLQEQSLEIQKYEEKIHHLADQNIQIGLDEGVRHNYELFAEVLANIK